MARILAVDPGLSHTGWAVIEAQASRLSFVSCGTISTKSDMSLPERLKIIYDNLLKTIDQFKPEDSAIEDSFVNNNPLSSLKLGQARAAAILALISSNIGVSEYAPRLVKKSVVGTGKADKEQIMSMVKYLLPTSVIKTEHEADALAIAITHSNISTTSQRLKCV